MQGRRLQRALHRVQFLPFYPAQNVASVATLATANCLQSSCIDPGNIVESQSDQWAGGPTRTRKQGQSSATRRHMLVKLPGYMGPHS